MIIFIFVNQQVENSFGIPIVYTFLYKDDDKNIVSLKNLSEFGS